MTKGRMSDTPGAIPPPPEPICPTCGFPGEHEKPQFAPCDCGAEGNAGHGYDCASTQGPLFIGHRMELVDKRLVDAAETRLKEAERKAETYERDWMAAKYEFGCAMAKVSVELAALRETIVSAPKLWIVLGADGETVIKSGSEVDTKAWAESENDFLGVSKAYIAMPARLVLLDPKEQP